MIDMGTTNLTNAQLLDTSNNGRGLIRDLWTSPTGYFKGAYQIGRADCMIWLKALLEPTSPFRTNLKIKNYEKFYELFDEYVTTINEYLIDSPRKHMGLQYRKVMDWDPDHDQVVRYPVNSFNLGLVLPGVLVQRRVVDEDWDVPSWRKKRIKLTYEEPGQPTYAGPKSAGKETVEDPALSGENCRREGLVTAIPRRDCKGGMLPDVDQYMFARVNGTEHQIAVVNKSDLVVSHGRALSTLGPTFVSLDLVNNTWTGDAVGVAVGLTGWIFGISLTR